MCCLKCRSYPENKIHELLTVENNTNADLLICLFVKTGL